MAPLREVTSEEHILPPPTTSPGARDKAFAMNTNEPRHDTILALPGTKPAAEQGTAPLLPGADKGLRHPGRQHLIAVTAPPPLVCALCSCD